jgi:hypothetical protein
MRIRAVLWAYALGLPLFYLTLVAVTIAPVLAQRDRFVVDSAAQRPTIDQVDAIKERLNKLEGMQLEKRITAIEEYQKAQDRFQSVVINILLLVVGGVILTLGLQVLRLTIAVRAYRAVPPRE